MKVYKINKFTYTVDFPVIFLFFGVSLDVISTFIFVTLDAGREMHPILGKLISTSIWFIPIYLFITNALFIPFLSRILRKTLSYTIGLSGFLFSLNNFSLVIFRNAFLVDKIGYTPIIITFLLLGFILFLYNLKLNKLTSESIKETLFELFYFIIVISLLNSLFLTITFLPIN